jgi:UbiD family decarboxylase
MALQAARKDAAPARRYNDFRQHVEALERAGLLYKVDRPINKDTEMHPLVRWQFRGGVPESQRKAFLFTNVRDSRGRKYDMPVLVGGLSATPEIYSVGMGVKIPDIGDHWAKAQANPIPPIVVSGGACQDVIWEGADLIGEGKGLDALPVPISSPGFDSAPYFTATAFVTKDPETGVQNMGTYRCGLKAPNRMAVMMSGGSGGRVNWYKYKALGKLMPAALVLGPPPLVAYCAPQRFRIGLDEMTVAGGAAGEPLHVTQAHSVDLLVPAESEIVIEGLVDTEYLEPEGPFGESHGYVALEAFNFSMEITAITMRAGAVLPSIISQVTPSESSIVKRVAMEPSFLRHLRTTLNIRGVTKVILHEPLTNIRPVIFLQCERGMPATEVWRALYGTTSFQNGCGKYVIALNDDIDPTNGDFLLWALAYRCNPILDVQILDHRQPGHGPKVDRGTDEDSTMLIDATLKGDMPPISLPGKEYMEGAKKIWDELGLPALTPEAPWHGYSLGNWMERWDEMAARAAAGDYLENGRRSQQMRRSDVSPSTSVKKILDPNAKDDGDDGE